MNDMGYINSKINLATEQVKITNSKNTNVNKDKIQETAKDFEAVFLSQMLSHMFSGIKSDGIFGGGQAEEIYRSMMINEYGKQIADAGGLGIADEIAKFMLEVQEGKI